MKALKVLLILVVVVLLLGIATDPYLHSIVEVCQKWEDSPLYGSGPYEGVRFFRVGKTVVIFAPDPNGSTSYGLQSIQTVSSCIYYYPTPFKLMAYYDGAFCDYTTAVEEIDIYIFEDRRFEKVYKQELYQYEATKNSLS